MDVDEGISLLLRGHSDQDIKQHLAIASKIVDRLGGLPLAIDQAAAYIRYERLRLHQLDTFLKLYDLRREEILSHIPPHFWEYGTMQIHGKEEQKKALSAFTTWEMSLEQVKTDNNVFSNEMTHFLTLSAFLNHTRIEEWLFRHYSERHHCIRDCAGWERLFSANDGENDVNVQSGESSSNAIKQKSSNQKCKCRWSPKNFWNVLSKFCELSLIQSLQKDSEGSIFTLHPLIRDWLQFREDEGSRRSMVTESVAVVAASVKLNGSQPMSLEQRASLLAHIDACVTSDDQFTAEQYQLGHDIQNCGKASLLIRFYISEGRLLVAEKLLRRMSSTRKKSLGMEHVDTLTTMSWCGALLLNQGRYEEAERSSRQTAQLGKRILGNEHEMTLDSLRSLAMALKVQYKYNEAENIQRQLLQTHEEKYSKRDPDTIECSTNLAETLRLQGKSVEAEKMQRETLQLSETLLGRQHRNTVKSMLILLHTLQDQQKHEEAEKLGREVLQLYEQQFGKQHPNTLSVMHSLAQTVFDRGRTAEAVHLCRDMLDLRVKVLGKNHPGTLRNMQQLAWMLSNDESSYDEAEELCRQTLVLAKEVWGREHPHTLATMSLLGRVLSQHESSYHEAEEISRETFQLRKRVLGSENWYTLNSMSLLGEILSQHESSYHEAEDLLRETYQLRKRVLGSEDPSTRRTMRSLVKVLQLQGKWTTLKR